MTFLAVRALSHQISDQQTLENISFTLRRKEKLAIAGETGSGKSTLLKVIAGLVQKGSGEVLLKGEAIAGPLERLVPGHPNVGYLSQHFELPKFLRVEQILSYSNALSESVANDIFEICQIDHLLQRKSDQLSGGERQRIALARLLTGSASLLLLDEPFSNLDLTHKNTLKAVIDNLSRKLGIAIILVSHDPGDTLPWADKIVVMRGGRIVQQGDPVAVYFNPVDDYTAGLFGAFNTVDQELAKIFGLQMGPNAVQFVRPERISIVQPKKGIRAVVDSCSFYGSYCEIRALVRKRILIVRSLEFIPPGESIYLGMKN